MKPQSRSACPAPRRFTQLHPRARLRSRLDYILRLPSHAPYAVRKFTHPAVRQQVARRLSRWQSGRSRLRFSLGIAEFPREPGGARDSFSAQRRDHALAQNGAHGKDLSLRKLSYSIEARKMSRYETRTLQRFQHVIAVSDHDRDAMLTLSPGCPITVVPTGVDTEQYRVVPPASANPPLIVFTGSMDWEPNIDAVEYFCREIWPIVLAAYPNARFQIVGRSPHPRVQRLASASVEVTGTVPSVTDYLRAATVVIVPLRIGGGTRLKIFEAMAMAKAMVSTTIGAEGLDVSPWPRLADRRRRIVLCRQHSATLARSRAAPDVRAKCRRSGRTL